MNGRSYLLEPYKDGPNLEAAKKRPIYLHYKKENKRIITIERYK